jgi:DegV family protein with EDD domain
MKDFVIVTDSGCDIDAVTLKNWGVRLVRLSFRFEGEDQVYADMPVDDFYARMKAGAVARTAAANMSDFRDAFEPILREGKDILYVGFSTGLSTTANAAAMAAEELKAEYPDACIETVDTLCASAGEGLMVKLAVDKKNNGATLAETAKYVRATSPQMAHWFTVDDLVYLKRGGRVSPTVAFVGGLLGIKPVLHVDDEGHLISVSKVKGRKAALNALIKKLEETRTEGPIFISQADCRDQAVEVAKAIEEKTGEPVSYIADIGPVIGAHAGPGTMAVFFLSQTR